MTRISLNRNVLRAEPWPICVRRPHLCLSTSRAHLSTSRCPLKATAHSPNSAGSRVPAPTRVLPIFRMQRP